MLYLSAESALPDVAAPYFRISLPHFKRDPLCMSNSRASQAEMLRIALDPYEAEALLNSRFACGTAAHEAVENEATRRRYQTAEVGHQLRWFDRWVGIGARRVH